MIGSNGPASDPAPSVEQQAEDLLLALPAWAKDQMRAKRRHDRWFAEAEHERRRQTFRVRLVEGIVLFLLVEWMAYGLTFVRALACLGAGALAGTIWHVRPTGGSVAAVIALALFVGLRLMFGWGGGLAPVFGSLAMLVLGCLAAAMSVCHDSERLGA